MLLFDPTRRYHPEFRGYQHQLVEEADVTTLQYPRGRDLSANVVRNDLNFHVQRADPLGPSMSDAVNETDTSALGLPGRGAYVYTERSILPFMRDYFDQFSETRTGGAFTFMTGIGGFLQDFPYGYSGPRWHRDCLAEQRLVTAGPRPWPSGNRITWRATEAAHPAARPRCDERPRAVPARGRHERGAGRERAGRGRRAQRRTGGRRAHRRP